MSTTIPAMEARQKFGEILNRVSLLKEEIIIERAGKPIAKLCPIDSESSTNSYEGKLDFRSAAGLGQEVWKTVDTENYIKNERKSWD